MMKKKNMKKFAALTLAAAMAVSMTACGEKAGDTAKDSTESSASSDNDGAIEVTSVDDLKNLEIGVQTGTTGDSLASEAVEKDSQMHRYNKGADAVQALKTGQIDAVVIDSQPAAKFVEANDDLKIVDGIFDLEEYAIALKKGNTELQEKINGALNELKEDGTIDEIISNYIGDEAGEHPYTSPENVDRSNGTLIMATNAEFEPYEYKIGDDIVGIDPDIAQAICDKLGYELQIDDMAFESILAAISSGKADFGAAGMTVNEERLESVDFTDTYASAEQVVILKK